MEDIYVLGISHNYTPPSPSFNMDTFNVSLCLDKQIDSITKISCCATGTIEETFKSLETNYASVYVNIEFRIDYMCTDSNMNFHKFNIDKIMYVNLGKNLNKRLFNVDSSILDVGVLSIKDNLINIYSVFLSCIY